MALNILVVDDSHTMRKFIIKAIEASGVDCGLIIEAQNGREALKKLEEHWIDIILTDINMPEMNGIEFIKKIRESEVHKKLPIVVITTERSISIMKEVEDLGIEGYMKKPFTPEEIRKTLTSLIGKEFLPDQ
ncbi:response regulator [archaeon]|nr:MAG: response regulator [archaeon]